MKNVKEETLKALDLRIFGFYGDITKLKKGVMPLPKVAKYHPTYLCNHNCIGCDYSEQNKKFHHKTSNKDANKLIDEFIRLKVRSVDFSGGGEATLHPEFNNMVLKLAKHKISMGLLTNGSMLKGELLKNIVKHGAYIRISLESGSEEVFKKVKRASGEEFQGILENIRNALVLRDKLNQDCDISLKFTVGKENYEDMENAIKLAIDLGVDSIQFKRYRNVREMFEDWERLNLVLDSLKKEYSDRIPVLGDFTPSKLIGNCWLNPLEFVIDAYGDVYMCHYYRHRMKDHYLGNMLKQKLENFWGSKEHWDKIRKIDPNKCNVYDCSFHHKNALMDQCINRKILDFI
ncbi:hypothetical protein CL621_04220 [archaeon]|nr:hypothetical protein [archaeon]|tara:strand:+ start:2148 stop:3185 length:1038 start_codon:yes stop_codon:yes gene_type:complete